jgi:hypothetical protein
MASNLSLGFRASKYVHPLQDENDSSKTKAESKGWTPIRQVIAIADERERKRHLKASVGGLIAEHVVSSRRPLTSAREVNAAFDNVKASTKKRNLRLRQIMPALQG